MTKKDDAVSPVIGTILLVAITVVLVAIVAAVVMGMVGGVPDFKTVGVTVTPYANSTDQGVILTLTGGKDAAALNNVTLYMNGVTNFGDDAGTNAEINLEVGKSVYVGATLESGGGLQRLPAL